MSQNLARYRKRIARAFDFNGETYHVRGLTNGEIARAEKLENTLKNSLFFGFGLLSPDGSQEFTQNEGETDAEFAERIRAELTDVPLPTMRELIDQIVKTTMPPKDAESLIKN